MRVRLRQLATGLLVAGMACCASAQVSQFEGRPISDIQFIPSDILHPSDLAKAVPLKKGEALHAEDISKSIDGLFATGQFEDIVVEGEASGNGVVIRFVTKPTWFVGGVTVGGKVIDPPNRGQVASAAQLNLGTPFHDEDVTNALKSIQTLLEANGFYESHVNPEVQRENEAQQVFLSFDVKAGKRAKYDMPVIEGETKLSTDTILRATGWRLPLIHWWRHVTESHTRGGVRGILSKYASQDRLKARVDLNKLEYDAQHRRVHPYLSIDPGPKVKVTAVEAKVSKRIMKRYVPVYQEGAVDNDLLVEGKRNLSDYFQSQGYYDVDVDFRVAPPQNDLETVEYVISRGERFKLVHIEMAGNQYFDVETLRERMFMQPATFRLRHGRYSEAFRRKDEENISNLYRSNGFRDVKVTTEEERDYKGKAGDVGVTVKIDEGQQWFIDELEVNGVAQVNAEQLKSALSSLQGQPFADINLATDRNYILSYYYSHGFPAAYFTARWTPAAEPHHVNVVYTIKEGNRQYVRGVLTSGLRSTRTSLVDKAITLKIGDPLSPLEQTNIQKRFYDLGIFARVDTAIQNPDGDIDHKYVLYNFDEANRYTFSVGFGAQIARFGTPSTTSLDSPGGATGFSPQFSVNASRLNFLGRGHMVSFRGVYSSIEKRASISYLQPRFRNVEGRNVTYSILYDNTLDVRTFAAKREEASVQMSQIFSKSLTGLFRFAYRRVSVSDVVIPTLLIPQLVQPVRIGMLSFNLAQDRRDNPADPHKGIYNTGDVGVASRFFGSQRGFARLLLRNATYYSLTKNVVLARQTQFGVIVPFDTPAGISAEQSVPLPERFFGGGADSLRAFPYNQAGPRDIGTAVATGGADSPATGFPLGGNALFFNNVELRFPLIGDNIRGVLFHDMGNVYSTLSNISFRYNQRDNKDFDYAVHAVGFGLRYRTPVGPIRGDLAYSLNPPAYVGFKGTALDLLGCVPNASPVSSACQSVPQRVSHFQFFFSIGQTF